MTLQGVGACTCIMVGYNPCRNNKPDSGMVCQQHRRFIITQSKATLCPQKLFPKDLVMQLQKWQADGNQLVICLNANKDIYKKSICKALTNVDGLLMKEVVGEFTGKKIGPTYFWGSKPIDGIWSMAENVEILNACIMPADYRIGDHQMFLVDVIQASLISDILFQVQRVGLH
jgi:hypothetical protein